MLLNRVELIKEKALNAAYIAQNGCKEIFDLYARRVLIFAKNRFFYVNSSVPATSM